MRYAYYITELETAAKSVCGASCGTIGSSRGERNSLILTPPPTYSQGIIPKSGAAHWAPDSLLRTGPPLRGFVRSSAYMFIPE